MHVDNYVFVVLSILWVLSMNIFVMKYISDKIITQRSDANFLVVLIRHDV